MFTLNYRGRLLKVDRPLVMGIINTTPDSFYPGSRLTETDSVLYQAEKMIEEGAAILDIGGQSTRPGSKQVPADEELKRVLPAIEAIHKRFPEQPLSIDTFYSKVALMAVEHGAGIVNDISAGTLDDDLLQTVAELKVAYILMHMKGVPETMQQHPQYKNVTLEVFDELNFKIAELKRLGIKDIIIDPGLGFGKTHANNFKLLKELAYFRQLGHPVLIGISRKGTIYKTLKTNSEQALNGTTVLNTVALLNGAHILRVHDVKEAVEAVKLIDEMNKA